MAIELISFADLDIMLDLGKTEAEYPDLTLIQESVVDAFEDYTRRTFEELTYSESKFMYSKTKMIPLNAIPVTSVSLVTIDDEVTTDFNIRPYGIELGAKVENAEVNVTYIGGITIVPGNLKRAALLQTVYEYQNKDSIGIQTVSTEGGTTTKPELGLLREVKRLLNSFTHPFPVF